MVRNGKTPARAQLGLGVGCGLCVDVVLEGVKGLPGYDIVILDGDPSGSASLLASAGGRAERSSGCESVGKAIVAMVELSAEVAIFYGIN